MINIVRICLYALLLFSLTGCEKALIKDPVESPVAVFEKLWSVMDARYAMFDYKQTDWPEIYRKYRPMITAQTSNDELFRVCSEMLAVLKDGHVALLAGERRFIYNGYYTSSPHNFNMEVLKKKYLPGMRYQGIVAYATSGKVGYLYIPSFREDLLATDMDLALQQLAHSTSLIIDVRDNTGGGSAKVDALTAQFMKEKMLLKYDIYRKGPGHNDFYAPIAKYLSPQNNAWTGIPVFVLVNKRCFSSCNDFVLYMSQLTNVKLVGDQTGGGGGTPFDYELPNGWLLKYSASMAISPEGENIEDGISPDYRVSNSLEDDSQERDAIFQFAFDKLQ
ncbi:S41 family peptidase [Chitinophaga arvensicola]|uniref:Tricorn protease C1 domain-containing protein n=1 Tax=Chitinophaga arvensicola TaxID=29529 RepID=A0A1I0SA38_9BACT|nr:S41 family peptidase [Chitinophaga arvensicola]SEW53319.1 Tricorn protease C1 domain-containing protein [Chitinophaga arvensicola]